jgi:DNA-binding MarR family transcriptional regulator
MSSRRQLQALQASRRYGIGRLLLLGRRDFLHRLGLKMGNADAVVQARGRVLPYIDVDGTRSVDLARRMGLSKQAVGKLVRELEEDGLLYREADGGDGRAFLVKFTDDGLEYLARLHKCILQIEREYERVVGAERMQAVREALSLIAYGAEGSLEEGEAAARRPLSAR